MSKEELDILFAERLSELIHGSNYILSDMEESVGKTSATISRYASGEITGVKRSTIVKIANFFNVSPAWLAGLSDEKYIRKTDEFGNSVVPIPLLGTVKAGYNYLAQENWEGTVDIKEELAKTGDFFALRIKGDSMFETLWDGDIVAVRKQNSAKDGDIAVVRINGDEATVKKIKVLDNGHGLKLMPLNRRINPETQEPYYEDLIFTEEEIASKPVEIIGVVKRLVERNFK